MLNLNKKLLKLNLYNNIADSLANILTKLKPKIYIMNNKTPHIILVT